MKRFLATLSIISASLALSACETTESADSTPASTSAESTGEMGPVLRTDGKPTIGIGSEGPGSIYIDPINGGIGIDLGGGIGMPIG